MGVLGTESGRMESRHKAKWRRSHSGRPAAARRGARVCTIAYSAGQAFAPLQSAELHSTDTCAELVPNNKLAGSAWPHSIQPIVTLPNCFGDIPGRLQIPSPATQPSNHRLHAVKALWHIPLGSCDCGLP